MIIISVAILIGYFWGRSSVDLPVPEKIVEIKWTQGETIRDTIRYPVPKIVVEEKEVIREVPIPADTAALYATWKKFHEYNEYELDFSNDSLGVFKVSTKVTRNEMVYASSIIKPNMRTVYEKEVVYKVPTIQFYTMLGTSLDSRTNKLQFGIDLKNKFMIGASGIRLDDKYGYILDFGVKF